MFSRSLRKAAKFAPKKLFAQQHAATLAPSVQKRSVVRGLKDVYIEGGGSTDAQVLSLLQKSIGTKDDYVGKNPSVTFEQIGEQIKTELGRPIYYDENFVSMVNEMLGYKKDEIRLYCSGKFPEVQREAEIKVGENSSDFDWELMKKVYGGTSAKDTEIGNISKLFKRLRAYMADNRQVDAAKDINWSEWEKRIDQEAVNEVKTDVETVKKLLPRLDAKKVVDAVNDQFDPLFERLKDGLIEELPNLKQVSDDLVKESPLLKADENGVPLVMMNTPEFLDEYYPELRDQIIEEIELGWWDTQYRDERKKLKITPDSLITFNNEWRRRETDKNDEVFKNELLVAASITPEAKAFQQMYLDVIATAKKNYELEAEVSQLKYQIEAQQEESAKKETATGISKKTLDPSIRKILEKYSTLKMVVKEFPGIKKSSQPAQKQQQQEEH